MYMNHWQRKLNVPLPLCFVSGRETRRKSQEIKLDTLSSLIYSFFTHLFICLLIKFCLPTTTFFNSLATCTCTCILLLHVHVCSFFFVLYCCLYLLTQSVTIPFCYSHPSTSFSHSFIHSFSPVYSIVTACLFLDYRLRYFRILLRDTRCTVLVYINN